MKSLKERILSAAVCASSLARISLPVYAENTPSAQTAAEEHDHNCDCGHDHDCDDCGECDCAEMNEPPAPVTEERETDGATCYHENVTYEDGDCWVHIIVFQDCGKRMKEVHSGPYYGQDGTCKCGIEGHFSFFVIFAAFTQKGAAMPVLFCSVLFCSVLFCSVLFCSVLFCSVRRVAQLSIFVNPFCVNFT